MLGFYPADPISGEYRLGSPVLTSATTHINRDYYPGTRFVLKAPGNSGSARDIRSATLNGSELRRAVLTHATITAGGALSLVMDSVPSSWGD